MNETYVYTEDTWDMLARAAIDWQEVDFVLRESHPKVRRFPRPSVLMVTAMDRGNRFLRVVLSETGDDVYEIVAASYLDDEQGEQVRRLW